MGSKPRCTPLNARSVDCRWIAEYFDISTNQSLRLSFNSQCSLRSSAVERNPRSATESSKHVRHNRRPSPSRSRSRSWPSAQAAGGEAENRDDQGEDGIKGQTG